MASPSFVGNSQADRPLSTVPFVHSRTLNQIKSNGYLKTRDKSRPSKSVAIGAQEASTSSLIDLSHYEWILTIALAPFVEALRFGPNSMSISTATEPPGINCPVQLISKDLRAQELYDN